MQNKNKYDLWKSTKKCLKWPICTCIFVVIAFRVTAWKVLVFGVILVHIFPHSDWILRESSHFSVFCRKDQIRIRIRKTPKTDSFHAVCVFTYASIHYEIPVYSVTTLKIIQRKTGNTDWYWSIECLRIFFDNILGRFDVVLKRRGGGVSCTFPLYPSCLQHVTK